MYSVKKPQQTLGLGFGKSLLAKCKKDEYFWSVRLREKVSGGDDDGVDASNGHTFVKVSTGSLESQTRGPDIR